MEQRRWNSAMVRRKAQRYSKQAPDFAAVDTAISPSRVVNILGWYCPGHGNMQQLRAEFGDFPGATGMFISNRIRPHYT